jgi:hypothetical protein
MSKLTEILIGVGIFYVGIAVGFILRKWLFSRREYTGSIYVTRNEDRILYSLELDENPEELEFRDEVIFKVKTSEENLKRN